MGLQVESGLTSALWLVSGFRSWSRTVLVGYCPHTVTVYNRASAKGLRHLYQKHYSTVTEWKQYPRFSQHDLKLRVWGSRFL